MSEIETDALHIGEQAGEAAIADLPTWASELKTKLESFIADEASRHQALVADLRRFGVPIPALLTHYDSTSQTAPAPTSDEVHAAAYPAPTEEETAAANEAASA